MRVEKLISEVFDPVRVMRRETDKVGEEINEARRRLRRVEHCCKRHDLLASIRVQLAKVLCDLELLE